MACQKRERTGSCSHPQCPYPDETEHGYNCVDIVSDEQRSYCEMGLNCLKHCPHSFSDAEDQQALEAFKAAYPIIE